jgi:asparagine synthase (glutamine-hydrolysing)
MGICGIAVNNGAQPIKHGVLEAMMSELAIGSEYWHAHSDTPRMGLGAVSATGTASLWSSGSVTVVCDADLYNQRELQSGISPDSALVSTAALMATLYLEHGAPFLKLLRGAFALALWDGKSRTLLLCVDRFAIRPLCYTSTSSDIVFASYPRGILASQYVEKKVNSRAILNYFNYNVVPAPETAFAGVNKLNPGHYLIWKNGHQQLTRYWDLQYPGNARGSTKQLAHELLSRMGDAVRVTSTDLDPARTGCFLSGGTDSSSVVGLVTRIKGHPANTFSIGFAENRWNELRYAHLAASHFRTNHTDSILGPEETYQIIPKIVSAYDEPFANSSAIPTYWCAKLAKEHGISVLLAGDGGDELFGGNERYCTDQIFQFYQKVPRSLRQWIIEPAVFASPLSFGLLGKAQRYIRRSNMGHPERYCQWRLLQSFSPEEVLSPCLDRRNGNADLLAVMRAHYNAAPAQSELNRLLYIDVKMTLGDEDLPKVVRTSELAGVNVRFPYLDHPLAEFTGRLPASLKVRGLKKRYLFKVATRDLLPQAILQKRKHGFGLPIGFWLKTNAKLRAMSQDVLLDPKTYQRGYFQRTFIEKLFAHMAQDDSPYFGDLLWTFLMLELWHRRHLEGTSL